MNFDLNLSGELGGLHGVGSMQATVQFLGPAGSTSFTAGGSGGGGGHIGGVGRRIQESLLLENGSYQLRIAHSATVEVAPIEFRGYYAFGSASTYYNFDMQAMPIPEIVPAPELLLGGLGAGLIAIVRRRWTAYSS